VRSQWERQGGRRQQLHRNCTAFMAIQKRLHYDSTEFSRRLYTLRSRGVYGDAKASALLPHGVYTTICCFQIYIHKYVITFFITYLPLYPVDITQDDFIVIHSRYSYLRANCDVKNKRKLYVCVNCDITINVKFTLFVYSMPGSKVTQLYSPRNNWYNM
jgi:hypothetical protein